MRQTSNRGYSVFSTRKKDEKN